MAWTTPKTNWATGELVTAEDMNAVGENLAALKNRQKNAVVTVADLQATSRSFVDVDSDNLSLEISVAGGDVLVHFHGSIRCERARAAYIDLEVDGTRQGGDDGIVRSRNWISQNGYLHDSMSFTRLIQGLNAGSHTFKLKWKTEGLITLYAGAQFWVREI